MAVCLRVDSRCFIDIVMLSYRMLNIFCIIMELMRGFFICLSRFVCFIRMIMGLLRGILFYVESIVGRFFRCLRLLFFRGLLDFLRFFTEYLFHINLDLGLG